MKIPTNNLLFQYLSCITKEEVVLRLAGKCWDFELLHSGLIFLPTPLSAKASSQQLLSTVEKQYLLATALQIGKYIPSRHLS